MLALGTGVPSQAQAQEAGTHEASANSVRLGSMRLWPFLSFLVDEGDDASTLGFEFESYLTLGGLKVKNISYFEVNQFPRAIPGQPPGNVSPGNEPANGINDLLSAFWFSKAEPHHEGHHVAPGIAFQFPTAADSTLGAGKWSIGPSVDYEYENGRLFAGAIALQVWSVGGDEERKDVSMLMVKPFVYYSLTDKWDLTYVPYGVSVYWNKTAGEKVYFPLGGGAQRSFEVGSVGMNLGAQIFRNVVRPSKGTVWDLRFLFELAF